MNTIDKETMSGEALDQLSKVAVARRRALLRGVGKGAAVLAGAVPLQSLAGQSLLTEDGLHQCSVSGQHSGVHSATPLNTSRCGGYSPGWWGQKNNQGKPKNWPYPGNNLSWSLPSGVTYETACRSVFTKSILLNTDGSIPSLWQVMEPKEVISRFSDTDEFHWVGAWLNALSHSFNFPYTANEVLAFYNDPTKYADALLFIKTYMELHVP